MPKLSSLDQLRLDRETLASQLAELDAALRVLERYSGRRVSATPPKRSPRKQMSASQKKAVSLRMKAYWKAKRQKG
jgi:hypothetical protein